MLITRKRRIDAAIDMTPLIDVVFQLLIFLMVSSQFIKPNRQVDLPAGPLAATTAKPDDLSLSLVIFADGTLKLEGEETPTEDLAKNLRDVIKHTDLTTLVLTCDQAAEAGIVFLVMEIARENGILRLVYEKENELTE